MTGGGPVVSACVVPPSIAALQAAKKKVCGCVCACTADALRHARAQCAPMCDKVPAGSSAADCLTGFKKKLDEGVEEAKVLDSDLNLSFNLGLDVEAKPDEQLEVVTEGYLHTKFVQLEEGHAVSNKMVRRAWANHKKAGRERTLCCSTTASSSTTRPRALRPFQ